MKLIKTSPDMIKEFAEKNNLDKELLKKQYYYLVSELKRRVEETNEPVFSIRGFGTFYIGVTSCSFKIRSYEQIGKKELVDIYQQKWDEIQRRLDTAKEKGIKKLCYLRKVKKRIPINEDNGKEFKETYEYYKWMDERRQSDVQRKSYDL